MLSLRSSHTTEWLKWPRPTSGPAMNINSINKLTQHLYLVTKTPLIQTIAVRKSNQKTRSCGKCGQSHPQGQCPAHGKTCHSCGRKGHWTEMCRTRRNSSTGCTPSPHPPNRQRRPSGSKPFKQQGGGGGKGGGKFFKKGGTPNKHKKGGAPPKKTHSLKLVISEEETVSNCVGISGPTHPP